MGDNGDMSTRSPIAFLVGAALFALAPLFDSVLPGERPDAGVSVWIALIGRVVGLLVVMIAGNVRARGCLPWRAPWSGTS